MKRYVLLMALLLLAASPPVMSQGWNINLISTLPDSEAVHAVDISGDYAYTVTTSTTSKLHIINVADPSFPVETGLMQVASNYPYALKVEPPYAYIAGGDSGLIIVNISDSSQPYAVANSPGLAGNVTLDGNYAYVVNGYLAGLSIINVADPLNPIPTGYISVEPEIATSLEVAVDGGFAYVADGIGLLIINVIDPANPVRASGFVGSGLSDARHVALYDTLAYVSSMYTVAVINISDPHQPVQVGEFTEDYPVNELAVSGSHLYLGEGYGGFKVLSLTPNPVQPLLVGWYDTEGIAHSLTVKNDNTYVADWSDFSIYDCSQALPVVPEIPAQPPSEFILLQNCPNPFNAATAISYQLPFASQVKLNVYDTSGRLVSTLVDGWQQSGTHSAIFNGSNLASGVYLYRLTAKQNTAVGKMALLK